MGFSREIVVYQNPNFNNSQIQLLFESMIKGDWQPFDYNGYVHFKVEDEIQSLPADDEGIQSLLNAITKAQTENKSISIQFTNKQNHRKATLLYSDKKYTFHLEIGTTDNQYELFEQFHTSIKNAIPAEFHGNKIEWINNYNEEIVRCETDMYHEGVLILASHENLKKHYQEKDFDYSFPSGLEQLLKEKVIIAIDAKDNDFTTILETEKISNWQFGYINSIQFEENDELLILHHGDFTMICDSYKGDYVSYGWKHIISIPIEIGREQSVLIAKPEDENDRKLIFQLIPTERAVKRNRIINIEEIPTHNKWS